MTTVIKDTAYLLDGRSLLMDASIEGDGPSAMATTETEKDQRSIGWMIHREIGIVKKDKNEKTRNSEQGIRWKECSHCNGTSSKQVDENEEKSKGDRVNTLTVIDYLLWIDWNQNPDRVQMLNSKSLAKIARRVLILCCVRT